VTIPIRQAGAVRRSGLLSFRGWPQPIFARGAGRVVLELRRGGFKRPKFEPNFA